MPKRAKPTASRVPEHKSDPPPRHAMRGVWRDPDDITPGARRTPKEIRGWRTFCPLRRMMGHPNSGIIAQHIMAADRLRELVDLAAMGYSAVRPLIYVAQLAAPRWGMGPAAIAQLRAAREVRRVVLIMPPFELLMIEFIVLRNMTVSAWTQGLDPPSSPRVEKRKLMVALDRLAIHFDREVQDDLARGRRLAP